MADNIKISLVELDNKIEELKVMKDEWVNGEAQRKGRIPDSSGGGQSVNTLELIVQEYNTINDSLLKLIENTILFLSNIRNSISASDNNAADAIKN